MAEGVKFQDNALVTMYAKCGIIGNVHYMFDKIPQRNVASWTALIAGYSQNGDANKTWTIFYQIQLSGVTSNSVIMVSVIRYGMESNVLSAAQHNARSAALSNLQAFTLRDLEFTVKFAEEHGSDIFRQILHSICPSIYGHELVKAGITLALFGGVQKHLMDQNKVPVRGDIHVIIVGDPGLGKSQLLQAAVAVAPRGIYVCGNTTTNAGLTVAVVKDAMTGDYAFEAGAMVLADRGVCCIDEFDKMSAEHQALLEAMEQQCVSFAKAGLVASISARTSILAAANPVGGHYNRAKTVNENLKALKIVALLLDSPCYKAAKVQTKDPLPGQLLRKYITYAKQFVFQRMSSAAAEVLQQFYLQLRNHGNGADGTPITARQLESLVRLVEARA